MTKPLHPFACGVLFIVGCFFSALGMTVGILGLLWLLA